MTSFTLVASFARAHAPENDNAAPVFDPTGLSCQYNESAAMCGPSVPVSKGDITWFDAQGAPTVQARALARHLQDSASHGLNPAAYDTARIVELTDHPASKERTAGEEKTLTRALERYVMDMTRPRVDPVAIGSGNDYRHAGKPVTQRELSERMTAADGDMNAMLDSLAPRNPLYNALRGELRRLSPANPEEREKALQVAANLERLRWDPERPQRYIEVNIAAQRLQAFDGGAEVNAMKVIVGQTSRQTEEIATRIIGVRFNPEWNVPDSIVRRDKLPDLRKNPRALDKMGMEVYINGRRVVARDIDWNNRPQGFVSMRQPANRHNALGHIRVLMPNRFDQYLHFTNKPELFAEENRFLSSGCMRMEKPEEVAAFILSATEAEVRSHRGGRENDDVRIRAQVPFYSVYRTNSLGEGGEVLYHQDTYGRNERLILALRAANALPPELKKGRGPLQSGPAP